MSNLKSIHFPVDVLMFSAPVACGLTAGLPFIHRGRSGAQWEWAEICVWTLSAREQPLWWRGAAWYALRRCPCLEMQPNPHSAWLSVLSHDPCISPPFLCVQKSSCLLKISSFSFVFASLLCFPLSNFWILVLLLLWCKHACRFAASGATDESLLELTDVVPLRSRTERALIINIESDSLSRQRGRAGHQVEGVDKPDKYISRKVETFLKTWINRKLKDFLTT